MSKLTPAIGILVGMALVTAVLANRPWLAASLALLVLLIEFLKETVLRECGHG